MALVQKGENEVTDTIIRRLTPTECERLQGFPDDWTLIGTPCQVKVNDYKIEYKISIPDSFKTIEGEVEDYEVVDDDVIEIEAEEETETMTSSDEIMVETKKTKNGFHYEPGFEYTDIDGKKRKCTDSARYKALGNSIALPQWFWLENRLKEHLPEHATLGSLFDGIGGFPLTWESVFGDHTARWASEIEPFCIAVTTQHFGNEDLGIEGDLYERGAT